MKLNPGLSARVTFGALLLLVIAAALWIRQENRRLNVDYMLERSADLEAALHVDQNRLALYIENLRQDTLFLSTIPPVQGMVRASQNGGVDPRDKNTYATWEARMQEIFSAFLRAHPEYFQIRFIAAEGAGNELVRVDNHEGQVQVIPHEGLLPRGNQDFFRTGLILTVGRVYLSEFHLARVGEQIEQPHRPLISAVTTVFDSAGRVFGMLVIDKNVQPLFASTLADLPRGVQAFVADQHGDYLFHPDVARTFATEQGGSKGIADDYPLLKKMYEAKKSKDDLPLQSFDDGYLTATRVFFDAGDPSRFLLLVYYLPSRSLAAIATGISLPGLLEIVLVTALIGGIFLFMLYRTFAPLKRITAAAREIAAGNRHVRLREKDSGEVGELTQALNEMLNALADSDYIKQESAFLRELIDSLPGIFYMLDARGGFRLWNRNLERVLKLDAQGLASSHPLDFFRGEDKNRIEQWIRQVFETGEIDLEAVLVASDGRETAYRFTGKRVLFNGEELLVGMGLDISARREWEEALRVAAAAFETRDAILITDAAANIVRVNRSFTEITGYAAEEVIGKNPGIMRSGRHGDDFYAEMWRQLRESGSWAGEIWDRRKNGEIYPKWMTITAVKNERDEIAHYVAIFSDITVRKQEEEMIRSMAFYDPLTRLANRRLFLDRLNAALATATRYGECGAILFIDLDRFKEINDSLGHEYGDLLLLGVAERVKACVREVDTVARFGGDEFVVLLENLGCQPDEAAAKVAVVAEKIRAAITEPYQLKEQSLVSSSSIGVALYFGGGETMDELLRRADAAMYEAKSAGRNAVRFFAPEH